MISSRIAILGVLVALGSATGAGAADLYPARSYQPTSGVVDMTNYFSWAGPYVGVLAGYGSTTQQFRQVASGGANVAVPAWGDTTFKGGSLGILAGVNVQVRDVVLGVEGDLDWARFKGSRDISGFIGSTGTVDANTTSYGTIRGRVGYAFNRVLPYLTGGLYWSQTDLTINAATNTGQLVLRSKSNEPGWVVGAGLEVAFDRHWSVKGEWLHVQQDMKFQLLDLKSDVETAGHTDIVRAGLNYRF